jgi:hypothetical protein
MSELMATLPAVPQPGTVPFIRGVTVFSVQAHQDERGELAVLEAGSNLEFTLKRAFYIKVESSHVTRAEHACSCKQVMIALIGGVTIDIDNGTEQQSVTLAGDQAVCIQPGIWLRLRDFIPGTVILVAANQLYAETTYYDRPQTHLIHAF